MLAIESGGIFFFDDALGVYAPMAISGFDETSSRRLRLPASLVGSWCGGGPASVSGADLEDFRMFFSSSEFLGIGTIRLVPLPYGEGKSALILSAEAAGSERDAAVPGGWPDIESSISGKLRSYASRFMRTAEQGAAAPSFEEAKSAFDLALSTAHGRSLKTSFIVIPLDGAIDAIKKNSPRADSYRLFAEARAAIARMFPIRGSVIELPGFRIGVLLASQVAPDPALILHQASKGLGRLFSGLGGAELEAERVLDPSSREFKLEDLFRSLREGQ